MISSYDESLTPSSICMGRCVLYACPACLVLRSYLVGTRRSVIHNPEATVLSYCTDTIHARTVIALVLHPCRIYNVPLIADLCPEEKMGHTSRGCRRCCPASACSVLLTSYNPIMQHKLAHAWVEGAESATDLLLYVAHLVILEKRYQ